MARSRTLTELLQDIRNRTNQENSEFVTDKELTEWLNQELAELWTRLVMAQTQPHYRSSHVYTVTSSTSLQALPTTFWALQEVTAEVSGQTVSLRPFMPTERASLQTTNVYSPYYPIQYRIQGGNIEWLPASQSFSSTLFYTPAQARLVNPNDTFDGFNGFEMCAIYGTCAQVMAKEESDTGFYERQKAMFYDTAMRAAAQRDMAHPERIQDVTADTLWPIGWGGWR